MTPRTATLIGQALDLVDGEVDARAWARGLIETEIAGPGELRPGFVVELGVSPPRYVRRYLPLARRDALLDELAGDPFFLRHLRNETRRIRTEAHLARHREPFRRVTLDAKDAFPRECGLWNVTADHGLGLASVLEAVPDGVAVAIRNRVGAHAVSGLAEELGLGEDAPDLPTVTRRVVVWGCGPGGNIARILDAMPSALVDFNVAEVDAFGEHVERHARCVSTRSYTIEELSRTPPFDLVVLNMSAPAEGAAAHWWHIYKTAPVRRSGPRPDRSEETEELRAERIRREAEEAAAVNFERSLRDCGGLGPTKWRRELRRRIVKLPALLTVNSEAILILPSSVRLASGYREEAALLEDVPDLLRAANLVLERQFQLVERSPVHQPFVGTRRPLRQVFIVRLGRDQ